MTTTMNPVPAPPPRKTPWVIAGVSGLVTIVAVLNAVCGGERPVPLEAHPPAACVSPCGLQLVEPIKGDHNQVCKHWSAIEAAALDAGASCEKLHAWEVGMGSTIRVDCAKRIATMPEVNETSWYSVVKQIESGCDGGT